VGFGVLMTRKEELKDKLERQLRDLEELETIARKTTPFEDWLFEEVNIRRFQLKAHLNRLKSDTAL